MYLIQVNHLLLVLIALFPCSDCEGGHLEWPVIIEPHIASCNLSVDTLVTCQAACCCNNTCQGIGVPELSSRLLALYDKQNTTGERCDWIENSIDTSYPFCTKGSQTSCGIKCCNSKPCLGYWMTSGNGNHRAYIKEGPSNDCRKCSYVENASIPLITCHIRNITSCANTCCDDSACSGVTILNGNTNIVFLDKSLNLHCLGVTSTTDGCSSTPRELTTTEDEVTSTLIELSSSKWGTSFMQSTSTDQVTSSQFTTSTASMASIESMSEVEDLTVSSEDSTVVSSASVREIEIKSPEAKSFSSTTVSIAPSATEQWKSSAFMQPSQTPLTTSRELNRNSSFLDWGETYSSDCSRTCGRGFKVTLYLCDRPTNTSCDKTLVHPSQTLTLHYAFYAAECNTELCPIDCVWLAWNPWSNCSSSCGRGTQRRVRLADGPYLGGRQCQGRSNEANMCEMDVCLNDGGHIYLIRK